MLSTRWFQCGIAALVLCLASLPAAAQSFKVQCPDATAPTHPNGSLDEPYPARHPGVVKCQQISGGDGFATMADGTQTYLFSFGPLSGLEDIKGGLPGTQKAAVFNQPYVANPDPALRNDPDQAVANNNGAVGLSGDPGVYVPDTTDTNNPHANLCITAANPPSQCFTGHVDAREIMDVGVLNGNMPAPLIAIDEDDELFLTLTNVGMIMRPDLFEQHTVHFHGYPNASSFYDGVPDASVAINIGGSFTYYYLAPDAGTYFWHCHITPPEHLQMGMVGQLYVRPRQNRVPADNTTTLFSELQRQQADPRTKCGTDILCSTPLPPSNTAKHENNKKGDSTLYAYNDGDGSTAYDVEYPIQIHGFDPSFHFVGMTFNPESFTDLKDKYFLLNGRSYPDTVTPGSLSTQVSDGSEHFSQPLPTIVDIPEGGKALLRISDLDVSEFQTLGSLGIPMHVIALNARLLRDQAGKNLYYDTNSITLGGGESLDVILDASDTTKYPKGSTFYLYTPNLDHLSNDAENFGGLMTEVHII